LVTIYSKTKIAHKKRETNGFEALDIRSTGHPASPETRKLFIKVEKTEVPVSAELKNFLFLRFRFHNTALQIIRAVWHPVFEARQTAITIWCWLLIVAASSREIGIIFLL
jgi:hypothetical protein